MSSSVSPDMPSDASQETWERLVERQRRENEGLRAAMRYRAVIEQAKGVLMARSGSDPQTAFRHLVAHSQRTNLKLTQVAAAVVARTITSPPVGGRVPSDAQVLEAATSDAAVRHLAAAAVVSAPDLQELLRTVVQHTQSSGVVAGTLALAEPDGALRLAGVHGADDRAVSGWKRIPPGTDLPICASASDRTPLWITDAAERTRRFPGSGRFPGHREACAVLPVVIDRQLVGVLALDWDTPQVFDQHLRDQLLDVADVCAAPLAELLRRYDEPLPGADFEPGHAGWFRGFLDSMPAPAVVLQPEFEGQRLVDLVVLFVNREARRTAPTPRAGRSLIESHPRLVDRSLLDHAEAVLDTDHPSVASVAGLPNGDGAITEVRDAHLYRVGSLLVLSWAAATG